MLKLTYMAKIANAVYLRDICQLHSGFSLVLKYKSYKKKFCMQKLTFCVYKVVQDEFLTQINPKFTRKYFFCNYDHYRLYHLLK